MHSPKFEMIRKFYNTTNPRGKRMWSEQMVRNAVAKGWITEAECTEILGK